MASLLTPLYLAVGLFLWALIVLEALVEAVVTFTVVYPLCMLFGGRPFTAWVLCQIVEKTIWRHMIFMLERWGCSRIEFGGEILPERESALLVANHLYINDYWILFSLAARKGRLGCVKVFAKNAVKYVPGFGWGGWILGFPFLRRNWTEDEARIRQTFENLKANRLPVWLVTHPESTRITPAKYAESVAYQKQHSDLPALRHLLLPRTKGFTATVQALRGSVLQAVYDVTLDYPEGFPSLWNLAIRQGPRIVVHVKRYAIAELPQSEHDLKQWCMDRWVEKDALLERLRAANTIVDPIDEPYRVLSM